MLIFTDEAWTGQREESRVVSSMSDRTWPQGLCSISRL
jgi:hypothetical protein